MYVKIALSKGLSMQPSDASAWMVREEICRLRFADEESRIDPKQDAEDQVLELADEFGGDVSVQC